MAIFLRIKQKESKIICKHRECMCIYADSVFACAQIEMQEDKGLGYSWGVGLGRGSGNRREEEGFFTFYPICFVIV